MTISSRILFTFIVLSVSQYSRALCPSPLIFKTDMEALMIPEPSNPQMTAAQASRFLTQATFGPSLAEIRRLQSIGYEAWLNQEIAAAPTLQEPCMQATLADPDIPLFMNSRMESWFLNSSEGEDQLRQRMAWALSQIFVVSDTNGATFDVMGLAKYYDLLAINAFGNFRDVLEDITLNTMMGFYLSMFKNAKADAIAGTRPDENYAREILQLFSIGLHQLNMDGTPILDGTNPIPTYDQTVIENFARVFTGWNYGGCQNWDECNPIESNISAYDPMEPIETYHDTGAKTLLNGFNVAAGGTARQDLTAALDNIFNHPNVPPFISKQLIQRFVTSNPSPQYVERVANVFANNGQGVRGDLAAVMRAILLDAEARNPVASDQYGKLKEPLIRLINVWRAFDAKSASGRYDLWNPEFDYKQRPLGAPSVFNFYAPSYQLPGPIRNNDLVSPEFQITSETTVISVANSMHTFTYRGYQDPGNYEANKPHLRLQREAELIANPEALMDHLNVMMFGGQMSNNTRTVALELLSNLEDDNPQGRVASLIYVLSLSPEFVIQR
ncbi:DUF1800 family protein [Marinicella sp. W31]|uniref:DUF1800 domain-containing protein n=1 Tax=Marinicella sp. W31 TaxID=3023713 RepID=UPI0037568B84